MKINKLLLVLLLLFTVTVNSQVLISLLLGDKLNSKELEFGLESGVNWSRISGMESDKSAAFFNIGFYFDYSLKNPQWAINTGVLVKANDGLDNLTDNDLLFLGVDKQEVDGVEIEGEYKQVINTFMVPAMIKYKFKNHIYVEGGMQFGLRYKSYVEFNADSKDIEERVRYMNKDAVQKLDAGLLGGLGYKLKKGKGFTVGAKYYYGFVDTYKEKAGTNSSSFFLKVNVPIGVKKAKVNAENKIKEEEKKKLEQELKETQQQLKEAEEKLRD